MDEFGGNIIFNTGNSNEELQKLNTTLSTLTKNMAEVATEAVKFNNAFKQTDVIAKLITNLSKLSQEQTKQAATLESVRESFESQIAGIKKGISYYDEEGNKLREVNTYLLKNNNILRENLQVLENGSTALKSYSVAEQGLISIKEKDYAEAIKLNKAYDASVLSYEKAYVAALKLNSAYDTKKMEQVHAEAIKLNKAYDASVIAKEKEYAQAIRLNNAYNENIRLQNLLTSGTLKDIQVTKAYNAAMGQEITTYRALTNEGKRFSASVVAVNGQLTNVKTKLQDAKAAATGLTLSWTTFVRIAAVQTIHRGIALFTYQLK